MRNLLTAGAAGLVLAFGAAGAAYAANPNVPAWSPYAVMGYDAPASAPPMYGTMYGSPDYRGPNYEGRAAYVDNGYDRPMYRHDRFRDRYDPYWSGDSQYAPEDMDEQ